MKYLIEIFWSDEDEGYIAIIPDLPGCSAWGITPIEAIAQIEDAKDAWIEACMLAGEHVPVPTMQPRLAEAA